MTVFSSQGDRPAPAVGERRVPTGAPMPGAQSTPAEAAADANRPSVLGKTLVFKGELAADEDLILQGRVEGSIHHTQSLTVGIDGVVIGDIHARSIVVEGTVEGDVHGSASVIIAATAKVRGNIAAPRVGVTEGALFNGSVDMSRATAASVGGYTAQEGKASSRESALAEPSVDRILAR